MRKGLSLLESIIAIAILAVLIGLLLSAIMRVRETAQRVASTNNLKQIDLALQNYISANDGLCPTIEGHKKSSSYAANGLCFERYSRRMAGSFPDGTSNTIAFGEHYGYKCGENTFDPFQGQYALGLWLRPASFADWMGIRDGDHGATFQVRPKLEDCEPGVAQTPHSSGMLVGLVDGSVRTVSGTISPRIYWAAMTPDRGEVFNWD